MGLHRQLLPAGLWLKVGVQGARGLHKVDDLISEVFNGSQEK